jgi:hypothetical protein
MNMISALELKRLLFELKDRRPDIGVRFRLTGKMWQSYFLCILQITEKGITLVNEKTHETTWIHDLRDIMEFELEHSFQQYQAHFHYRLDHSLVFEN